MIVTCDKCEQKARIKPEKLPPQGGKIRCPRCKAVIIIPPPDESGVAAAASSAPKPKPKAKAKPKAAAEKPKTPKAEPEKPKEEESEPDEEEAWKLRVSGLTYSFQDLDSVQQWLNGRDNVDGIKVARGSDSWRELGDYPGLLTDGLMLKFFPGGDLPKTSADGASETKSSASVDTDIAPEHTLGAPAPKSRSRRSKGGQRPAQRRVSRSNKASASGGGQSSVGKYIGAFVVVLALAAGLHFSGIADFTQIIPGIKEATNEAIVEPPAAQVTAKSNKKKKDPDPAEGTDLPVDYIDDSKPKLTPEEEAALEAEIAAEQEARRQAVVDKADELMKAKRWAEARAVLEPEVRLWPDNLEINKQLLTVYKRLKAPEAEAQKAAVEALETAAEEAAKKALEEPKAPEEGADGGAEDKPPEETGDAGDPAAEGESATAEASATP